MDRKTSWLGTTKVLVARKVVTDELELLDKATGEQYCVSVVNGELKTTKWACDSY